MSTAETGEMDSSPSACPSCGSLIVTEFCGACGERRVCGGELTLRVQVAQLVGGMFSFDGKVARSFLALVRRPGFLAVEYCRGARVRWLRPVQMLLLANLVYFVVQPATGFNSFVSTLDLQTRHQVYSASLRRVVEARLQASGQDRASFARSFDRAASDLARSLVVLLVPAAALAMQAVGRRGRRTYVEHLVFAANFVAFQLVFVYVGFVLIVGWAMRLAGVGYNEAVGSVGTLCLLGVWLVPAWRRFHATSLWSAVIAALILCIAQIPIVLAYRYVLFWLAYWMA